MPHETESNLPAHDPYAALRSRDFRLYLAGHFIGVLGAQMQTVAIGWEIYRRTSSSLLLGLVGLVQFLPVILLAPITGHVADRFPRRRIMMIALSVVALSAAGLAWIAARQGDPWLMFACLFAGAIARAFHQPARASFVPQIVPPEHFANAVTWNTGAFHLATVIGLSCSGLLIDLTGGAAVDFSIYAAAAVCFVILLSMVRARPTTGVLTGAGLSDFVAGFIYLWKNQTIFAAITLDLLAVLLGGATTLLPVYAAEILHVRASALSVLFAAPATGAFLMSIVLAYRPPFERSGRALLLGVIGFGICTIAFGLSNQFWWSLTLLLAIGALDNISVVIRHTLVQVLTPNELRGRVSAVNGLFIGASNELGGFESGLVAHWFGPLVSVVSGGIGTLAVVVFVAVTWPQLRRYGRLGSDATPK